MSTISQDLKERIVRSVNEDGLNQAATARRFAVAESTVSRTMRAYRERGTVAPLEFVHGRSPKLGDEHLARLDASGAVVGGSEYEPSSNQDALNDVAQLSSGDFIGVGYANVSDGRRQVRLGRVRHPGDRAPLIVRSRHPQPAPGSTLTGPTPPRQAAAVKTPKATKSSAGHRSASGRGRCG